MFFPVSPKTPTLSSNQGDETIASGTSVTLKCTTLSSGSVSYTIYKDNSPVSTNAGGSYTVNSAATSDSGVYTCHATIAGQLSRKSNVLRLNILGRLTQTVC